MDSVWQVAAQFTSDGRVLDVRQHGNGNINDTYLVRVDAGDKDQFILQRINTHVFKHPQLIIENLKIYADHVNHKLVAKKGWPRRWDVPRIRCTKNGDDYFIDPMGGFWRAISYVNSSRSYETVQNTSHASEAGYALGTFHNLVGDLDIAKMHDTLVGFHNMHLYLQQFDRARAGTQREVVSPEVDYCQRMIAERRQWAGVLENGRARGDLSVRIIHGDPKINNFMIAEQTGQAVALVDLDTVKPGLLHYDIGDCLRSSCNPLGEDTLAFEVVRFEIDLARAILAGYFMGAGEILNATDYAYIYDAIRLLPFEMGVRFFTDYLAGDVYFKVKHPEHNLQRAVVQFKLMESIEAQEREIRALIEELKNYHEEHQEHEGPQSLS